MILQAPPITNEEAAAFLGDILSAWRVRRPDLQLGQFLLLACAIRKPEAPATLLQTIETRALAELVREVPVELAGPVRE